MQLLSDTRAKKLAQWKKCVSHKHENLSAGVHNLCEARYGGVHQADAGLGESLEAQIPASLLHRA